jgi:hypothetical protein
MRTLDSGGSLLRVGVAAVALLAWSQYAVADAAKSVDDVVKESKKTGKPILAVLGTKT